MKKFNPIIVAGTVIIFVAFLLLAIGTGTTGWIKIAGINFGHSLSDFESVPEGQATEAFAVLSILASVGALGAMVVYIVLEQLDKMNDKLALLPTITHVITIVGAVFALIAIIIFAAKFYGNGVNPNYSWVLVIIGGVFLEVGGFLCHKAKTLSKIGGSG